MLLLPSSGDMDWGTYFLLHKDNQICMGNIIIVYEVQLKMSFCKGTGILLKVAFGLTIMLLQSRDFWTFYEDAVALLGSTGCNQPDYNAFSILW